MNDSICIDIDIQCSLTVAFCITVGHAGFIYSCYRREMLSESIGYRSNSDGGCESSRRKHSTKCVWAQGIVFLLYICSVKFLATDHEVDTVVTCFFGPFSLN
jgi:hypothetical protein